MGTLVEFNKLPKEFFFTLTVWGEVRTYWWCL